MVDCSVIVVDGWCYIIPNLYV